MFLPIPGAYFGGRMWWQFKAMVGYSGQDVWWPGATPYRGGAGAGGQFLCASTGANDTANASASAGGYSQ